MNVVDSSGWLEYFADRPNAKFLAPPLQSSSELLVPTLSLYESLQASLRAARRGCRPCRRSPDATGGAVVDLTASIALAAARLSLELKVPMVDSVMLATAREQDALFWTEDADFRNVPGVKYISKRPTT